MIAHLRVRRLVLRLVLSGLAICAAARPSMAAPVLPQSDVDPGVTYEPPVLPTPTEVPGKEYSNGPDRNAAGTKDPGQVVHWGGDGKSVWDSFDYEVTTGEGGGEGIPAFEVDALANIRDKYFKDLDGLRAIDSEHVGDTVPLLVSFSGNGGAQEAANKNIYASRSAFRDGSASLWADWEKNINAKLGALQDVDGLEIWGPDDPDDADMYSRKGDPDTDGNGRVSVFRFFPDTQEYVPYLRTDVLRSAVIMDNGQKPNWGTGEGQINPALFDLDALMTWDVNADNTFGAGDGIHGNDMVLFSICPIAGVFDGGEVWLYIWGDANAQFLIQGKLDNGDPRVWNTAHNVSQHFFGDNLHSEDIDALEALPEPGTLGLLVLGGVAILRRKR